MTTLTAAAGKSATSNRSHDEVMAIFKSLWLGTAVLVLFVTLYAFDGKPNSDIGIFLVWSMLFISFPASLIYAGLFSVVALIMETFLSTPIPTTYLSLTIDWVAFFILGYLQWFKLIPYVVTKLRGQK